MLVVINSELTYSLNSINLFFLFIQTKSHLHFKKIEFKNRHNEVPISHFVLSAVF